MRFRENRRFPPGKQWIFMVRPSPKSIKIRKKRCTNSTSKKDSIFFDCFGFLSIWGVPGGVRNAQKTVQKKCQKKERLVDKWTTKRWNHDK